MAQAVVGVVCQSMVLVLECFGGILTFQATDTHASLLLDRPPHIQNKFCDVPTLTLDDFEETDLTANKDVFRGTPHEQKIYVVKMIELSRMGIAAHV